MVRDQINNTQDVIDSRDVIGRIQDLERDRDYLQGKVDEAENPDTENEAKECLSAWLDGEDGQELKTLEALAEEAEGYASDWRHGETLIRQSYFVDYCKELCEDIGDMPKNIPSYIVIDWDATADNLKADYTEVDYGGVTYFIRCS